jgi:hypothetical protein
MPEVSIRTMLVLTITAWAGACTSEQPQAETTTDDWRPPARRRITITVE